MSVLAAHAKDWSKTLPFEHKSRYFEFQYQRASWKANEFARFADGFVDLVNRDFIKVEFDYPIRVLVLPDRARFQQFLREELSMGDPPNFGIYFDAFKIFVTYEDSGLGTFAHEIMHPLVNRNLHHCPAWASEAIPSFFEKFIGYWDGDRLVAQWGYQNPWRIRALDDHLTTLDLGRILRDKRGVTNFNNSERRLVTVFLWQHGKLQQFMRLTATRDRAGFRSHFEAAMEMPLKQIIPLWEDYLKSVASQRIDILQIPASRILENQKAFDQFMLASGLGVPAGR